MLERTSSAIQESSDLWDLEHYLTERRKQIDRKYDYRYSQLRLVLGRLLYENRLREEDLRGLREDKMKSIGSASAEFLRKSILTRRGTTLDDGPRGFPRLTIVPSKPRVVDSDIVFRFLSDSLD